MCRRRYSDFNFWLIPQNWSSRYNINASIDQVIHHGSHGHSLWVIDLLTNLAISWQFGDILYLFSANLQKIHLRINNILFKIYIIINVLHNIAHEQYRPRLIFCRKKHWKNRVFSPTWSVLYSVIQYNAWQHIQLPCVLIFW